MIIFGLPWRRTTVGRIWRIPNAKQVHTPHLLCPGTSSTDCRLYKSQSTSFPSLVGRLSICVRRVFVGIRNVSHRKTPEGCKYCKFIAIIRSSPAIWNGTCNPALGDHPGDGSEVSRICEVRCRKRAANKKRRRGVWASAGLCSCSRL